MNKPLLFQYRYFNSRKHAKINNVWLEILLYVYMTWVIVLVTRYKSIVDTKHASAFQLKIANVKQS